MLELAKVALLQKLGHVLAPLDVAYSASAFSVENEWEETHFVVAHLLDACACPWIFYGSRGLLPKP